MYIEQQKIKCGPWIFINGHFRIIDNSVDNGGGGYAMGFGTKMKIDSLVSTNWFLGPVG